MLRQLLYFVSEQVAEFNFRVSAMTFGEEKYVRLPYRKTQARTVSRVFRNACRPDLLEGKVSMNLWTDNTLIRVNE
jgi:hypothetical protein